MRLRAEAAITMVVHEAVVLPPIPPVVHPIQVVVHTVEEAVHREVPAQEAAVVVEEVVHPAVVVADK